MVERERLKENDYNDIAVMIEEVMLEWKREGKETRRNWWEVLAGKKGGKPRIISGVTFPVLKAAQKRQGLPVTPNAISRSKNEKAPGIRRSNRWKKDNSTV